MRTQSKKQARKNHPTMIQRAKILFEGLGALRNRYLITGGIALFWVTFVSDIDLIYLFKNNQELQAQERQVAHYEAAITDLYLQLDDLSSNLERLEKFAREHYFMKRENEDLFRILPAKGAEN